MADWRLWLASSSNNPCCRAAVRSLVCAPTLSTAREITPMKQFVFMSCTIPCFQIYRCELSCFCKITQTALGLQNQGRTDDASDSDFDPHSDFGFRPSGLLSNLYPTPCTVVIQRGSSGFRSILLRKPAM